MIVDITYHDTNPEQFQKVRLLTVYMNQDYTAKPEVVLHQNLPGEHRQVNIPLHLIRTIQVTND